MNPTMDKSIELETNYPRFRYLAASKIKGLLIVSDRAHFLGRALVPSLLPCVQLWSWPPNVRESRDNPIGSRVKSALSCI